jgi:hypothetical protein
VKKIIFKIATLVLIISASSVTAQSLEQRLQMARAVREQNGHIDSTNPKWKNLTVAEKQFMIDNAWAYPTDEQIIKKYNDEIEEEANYQRQIADELAQRQRQLTIDEAARVERERLNVIQLESENKAEELARAESDRLYYASAEYKDRLAEEEASARYSLTGWKTDPKTTWEDKAKTACWKGFPKLGLIYITKAIKAHPRNWELWQSRGELHEFLEMRREARADYIHANNLYYGKI